MDAFSNPVEEAILSVKQNFCCWLAISHEIDQKFLSSSLEQARRKYLMQF